VGHDWASSGIALETSGKGMNRAASTLVAARVYRLTMASVRWPVRAVMKSSPKFPRLDHVTKLPLKS
jgi:hypothetical protein